MPYNRPGLSGDHIQPKGVTMQTAAHQIDDAETPRITSEPSDLRFEDTLAARSRDRSIPKRERTRYLLLAIAAKHLRDDPSVKLSVETVIEEAGLSRGTFYNNFKDMDDLKSSLIQQFLQEVWRAPKKGSGTTGSSGSSYDAILETNRRYCRSYQANAGVFALFTEMAAQNPDLLRLRERMNADWVEKIVVSVARRRGQPFDDAERHRFEGVLRLLVAMTIEALRERFVHKDALLCRSFPTAESLAEMLSQIWYTTMSAYERPPGDAETG